jgi:hypothetical protein
MLLLVCRFVSSVSQFSFVQKLDHFDPQSNATFNQTYYISTPGADPPGRSIVLIGNWDSFNVNLFDLDSIRQIAGNTSATIYGLETRYFGNSFPDSSFEFLTVSQCLADLATFIDSQVLSSSPPNQHILIIGSGFAGSLAQWFRLKYPKFADSAWISSAPLTATNSAGEVDTLVSSLLYRTNQTCFTSVRQLFDTATQTVFSDDPTDVDRLLSDFGLPGISNTSFVKVLVDVVDRIILNSTLAPELAQICALDSSDLHGLAVIFNTTISKLSLPALSFDPLWAADLAEPGLPRDRRSRLRLMCNEVGWFRTAGTGDRHLTPDCVNADWYRHVCSQVFGEDIGDRHAFNLEFGGSSQILPSAIYTKGGRDVWSPFGVSSSARLRRETVVLSTGDEMAGADLLPGSVVIDKIVDLATRWMNSDCGASNCDHGFCYLHSCVCDDGFEGDECDIVQNTVNSFHWVSMAATFGPTILILAAASVAWIVMVQGRLSPSRKMSVV